jgi:hypothetical protein
MRDGSRGWSVEHVRVTPVCALLLALVLTLFLNVAPHRASAAGLNCADPFVCYTLTIKLVGDGSGTVLSYDGHIECFLVTDPSAPSTCSYQYRTLLTTPNIGVVLDSIVDGGSRTCFVSKSDSAAYADAPIPAPGDCTDYRLDPAYTTNLPALELALSGNATVEYAFDAKHLSLEVFKTGAGKGIVKSSPTGINCGAVCTATFAYGREVSLTATASPGSVFSGWSGACAGQRATCTVAIVHDTATAATFGLAAASPNASVRPTARGSGAPPPTTPASAVTLATPSAQPESSASSTAWTSSPESGAPPRPSPSAFGGGAPVGVTSPVDMTPIGIGIGIAGLLIALAIVAAGIAARRAGARAGGKGPR